MEKNNLKQRNFAQNLFRIVPYRIRKLFLKWCLCFCAGSLLYFPVWGQTDSVFRVNLNFEHASLVEVIESLREQTHYNFLFNSDELRPYTGITIHLHSSTLRQALDSLLVGKRTGLVYRIEGRTVIISKPEFRPVKGARLNGKVTDERSQPLPGATVRIGGTSVGTATNAKGVFSLMLPINQGVLEISCVGYKTCKVNFNMEKSDTLQVIMEEDIQALDEAIVVAYGTTTRRKSTGSISVVKAEEFKGIPSSNIANLLQGRIAGMDVTNLSGAPSGGDVAVTVRGYNSLDVEAGRRFSNPLWVVDGVPLNSFTSPITGTNLLSDLNPDMIESVQILKDASSAAIYGSRAANGVIIVTTKKGQHNQKATFSANVSKTWSILPRFPALTTGRAERIFKLKVKQNQFMAYFDREANRYKYPESLWEQYENWQGTYDAFWYPNRNRVGTANGNILQDSLNSFYNHSTNFFPMYYETGEVTNANIQAYGGLERITYGIGLGFYNENGVLKGTGFKRIDVNSNLTVFPVKNLKTDLRFNISINQNKRSSSSNDASLQFNNQILPLETVPGEPYDLSSLLPGEGTEVWEEILQNYQGTKETNRSGRLRGNFQLGYEIIQGLNLSTSLSMDYVVSRRNYFSPSYLSNNKRSISLGETGINLMVLNENLLSYSKTFQEKHSINFVAGFSYQYEQTEYNGGSARNSPSDKIYYAPQGMPDLIENTYGSYVETIALKNYQSDMQEKTLVSYFGRLEYNYMEKYLFSLSLRRDGSSTFGRNNRWGTFPSVAAGWSFSEENFVRDYLGWLSFGKLRASWGRSGMHFSQNYLALGLLKVESVSYLGNGVISPDWGTGLYNDKLSWEETDQYDFGLDLDLFDYRLGITLDYYYRYTDKLLNKVYLPSSGINTGYQTQWRNSAAISNEGLELMIKYEFLRKKDLFGKITLNVAKNWNRFEKSYTGKDQNLKRIIGKPLNGIYTFKTEGFINDQNEVPVYYNPIGTASPLSPFNINNIYYKPGDYKFVDVNGDRSITSADQVYCGSALPEVTGGIIGELRWRNFDLNLSFSFQLGRHILNYGRIRVLASPNSAVTFDVNDISFWEKPGDHADFPMIQGRVDAFLWGGVDRLVEKVNWLKMKTCSIGYTFPRKWMEKCKLNELRIFASGENLFSVTNYSGIDPETVDFRTGEDSGRNYPLARKLTLGLTLKF